MSDTLNIQGGYQYTFYITLSQTPITVSATIEPWLDGPMTYYDAIQVSTEAGESMGVEVGDVMNVYVEEDGEYGLLQTFTYNSSGRWDAASPVFWEDVSENPANFRASIIAADALNETQLPDILIADDYTTAKNTGLDLTFRHAASKAIIRLASNTFSADDLGRAEILLPNYLTGGYEKNGQFIEGTDRINILPVEGDNGKTAIFQPQTVSSGSPVATITLNGNTYTAAAGTDGFNYNAGEAKIIVINIDKEGVTVSATVVDWVTEEVTLDILDVSTPAGETVGVTPGYVMNVYIKDTDSENYSQLREFTYNQDGTWTPNSPLYWESIEQDPAELRASIIAAEPLNDSQMPDILIADDLTVSRHQGANFVLHHALSKVVVRLASETFTAEELAGATLTLPQYLAGGYEENGQYIEGTVRTNITVDRTDTSNGVAIIQPQTLEEGEPIITITINGRPYNAYPGNARFTYNPGEALMLTVNLDKEDVTISAHVIDWTTDELDINVLRISTTAAESVGVEVGDVLDVYMENNDTWNLLRSFTYNTQEEWQADTPIYWEDIDRYPANLRASMTAAPALNSNQVADILIADPISVPQYTSAAFTLRHAASKLIVRLASNTFNADELANATITLPGYTTGASAINGLFVEGTRTANITVDRTDRNNGIAIIQPQTISANSAVVTVNINGRPYTANAPAGGLTYNAGEALTLTVNLDKEGVTISANVVDWTTDEIELNVLPVSTPAGESLGVTVGDVMNVYLEDNGSYNLLRGFTYNAQGQWVSNSTPLYWEDIEANPATLRASIIAAPAINDNQIPDILIADDLSVPRNSGADFTLRHAASKLIVRLASNTFSTADLAGATITLPGYTTGATEVNGQFVPGTINADIEVDRNDVNNGIAIIQPQRINAYGAVATVTIN